MHFVHRVLVPPAIASRSLHVDADELSDVLYSHVYDDKTSRVGLRPSRRLPQHASVAPHDHPCRARTVYCEAPTWSADTHVESTLGGVLALFGFVVGCMSDSRVGLEVRPSAQLWTQNRALCVLIVSADMYSLLLYF